MNSRKIIGLLLIGFVLFYVFNSPDQAAHVVKNLQHLLSHLFQSLSRFLNSFG